MSGRDTGIRENWQLPHSYRSLCSARPEHDDRYGVFSRIEEKNLYGGDYRTWSPPPVRNPESEKLGIGGNRCFSCLNRTNDPVRSETGRYVEMGLVQRGEYSEERDRQWPKLSGFNESLSGMGRESTFTKFQWNNLLGHEKTPNANKKGNNLGAFSDSNVVPISITVESGGGPAPGGGSSRTSFSHLMDATDSSSRNYGLIDGGYPSSSPLGKFEVGEKENSFLDLVVDKFEGKTDIYNLRDNMMKERRVLLENETSFGEVEKDSRSLKLNAENLQYVARCGFERHGGGGGGSDGNGSYGDDFERLPISYEELCSTGSYSQRLLNPEEASEIKLRRKSSLDMETDSDDKKIMLSYDLSPFDGFEEIPYSTHGDGDWTYEDTKQSPLLENSGWGQYQGGIDGIMIDGMGINGNATSRNSLSSKFLTLAKQRNSSKPFKSSKRDLKHRLGPVQSVKQRLGPALNVGKSLGVAPIVKKKLPWFKLPKRKILDDCEQNINAKGVISSEVKKKRYAKTEPPEDTEEFMQLVQNAFLKFVKLLNENSFNRRKYLEKGGAGTLKCSICCSGSKEFVDTLSLAQHAFMSCKIGSRSEHLGLHKALCVLMGWKNTKVLNGQWVRQILPESEASSLKEDLIIWPPVVIIHNSSITNHNLNERMIVSIEGLKDILRGMGCEQRMTNLCRGKAANQSTMVVSFSGTFSGLQAAERLHGHFGEKKRGRAEFEQTISKGCKNNGEDTRRTLADKVESVIYGYLGIASDLDKLDFEIKKRCVVKSKKEIEAIANATFNTK